MPKKDNRHVMAWAVLYEDSCNPEYIKILQEHHLCFAVSPLHDMDHRADGSKKEPHRHIVIDYSDNKQKKSREQFQEIFDLIGAKYSPLDHEFFCVNRRLCYRYLLHLDDADKHLYSFDDIYAYGFTQNLSEIIFSEGDIKRNIIPEMMYFIVSNQITYYCDFAFYCANEEPEWNEALFKHNRYITEFIKSFAFFCQKTGLEGKCVYFDIDQTTN